MTITIMPEKTTNWLGVAEELSKDFATRAAKHDADDSFVAENYAALRKAKLFSAPVPAELGGGGASYADHAAIIRIIARGCRSTALHFGVSMKDPGVKVQDNWRTMGMRGTGSNDIVIENVTVQDAAVSVRRPKGKWHGFFDVVSPLIFPLVAAAYVGVAETAREIAVAQAQKRKDDPIVQSLVGEMDTELLAAQDALAQMTAVAAAGHVPGLATSNDVFKRKTLIARSATRVTYLAMEVAGGGSFFRSAQLERCFRDVQGIRFHPYHEKRQYQFSGRIALGIDPA